MNVYCMSRVQSILLDNQLDDNLQIKLEVWCFSKRFSCKMLNLNAGPYALYTTRLRTLNVRHVLDDVYMCVFPVYTCIT